MAFDYEEIANTAKELVEEFGREVVFERFNTYSQDENKPWQGPPAARTNPTERVTGFAAFVDPGNAKSLGLSTTDIDLLKRSQQIMIFAPGPDLTADLKQFQEVEDDGVRWKIEFIETLKPGSMVLLYYIGVSR